MGSRFVDKIVLGHGGPVGRDQIIEIEAKRRMTVGRRVALTRDLLVLEVTILVGPVQKQVEPSLFYLLIVLPFGSGSADGDQKVTDSNAGRQFHPIIQQRSQGGAHTADGLKIAHGFTSIPLPAPVAADHRVAIEATGHRCRLRGRGGRSRRCCGPYFYGAYTHLDRLCYWRCGGGLP